MRRKCHLEQQTDWFGFLPFLGILRLPRFVPGHDWSMRTLVYLVSQRQGDFGLCMALGAWPMRVLRILNDKGRSHHPM